MPVSADHLLTTAKSALLANAPDRALVPLLTLLGHDPDHELALLLAGRAAFAGEDLPRAIAWFTRLTTTAPDHPDGWMGLGAAQRKAGAVDAAEITLTTVLERRPDNEGAWNNLGNLLADQDRFDEAITAYERALSLKPDFSAARRALAGVLRDKGEPMRAMAEYDRLRADGVADAELCFSEALTRLVMGDFDTGWPAYEARLEVPELEIPRIPGTRWRGEAGAGAVLVVHAEQGFGDVIHFLRYLPPAKKRWGGKLIAVVQKPLRDLVRGMSDGADQILTDGEALPAYHRQIPLMSLPALLGTPPQARDLVPPPYLSVPLTHRHRISGFLPPKQTDRRRIGLCWRGSPTHLNDARRSISLPKLAPLLDLPDIDWVGLTKEPTADDLPALTRLNDIGPLLQDFSITAAVVQELDAVISVDSAVAHLAGALDRPVHLLLGARSDFRWERDRSDSRWYPSLTLHRQTRPGAWESVIGSVIDAIDATRTAA